MVLDVYLGLLAVAIGASLIAFSEPLAHMLREGDERWREERPWTQAYEPQSALLASEQGRLAILRGWLLVSGAGFVAVGAALTARAT